MGFFIKLILTCWPFIREMLLGSKPVKEFVREHKWVFGHIATSLLLFFLFINQLLANIHLKMEATEYNGTTMSQLEAVTGRVERQATRIDDLREQVKDLREVNKLLREELMEHQLNPDKSPPDDPTTAPQEAIVDHKSIIQPVQIPSTPSTRSRSYIDKLEQLRQSDY